MAPSHASCNELPAVICAGCCPWPVPFLLLFDPPHFSLGCCWVFLRCWNFSLDFWNWQISCALSAFSSPTIPAALPGLPYDCCSSAAPMLGTFLPLCPSHPATATLLVSEVPAWQVGLLLPPR